MLGRIRLFCAHRAVVRPACRHLFLLIIAALLILLVLLVVIFILAVIIVIIVIIIVVVILLILFRIWFRIGGFIGDGQLCDGVRVPIIHGSRGIQDLGDEVLLLQVLDLLELQVLRDLLQLDKLEGLKCGFFVHAKRFNEGRGM